MMRAFFLLVILLLGHLVSTAQQPQFKEVGVFSEKKIGEFTRNFPLSFKKETRNTIVEKIPKNRTILRKKQVRFKTNTYPRSRFAFPSSQTLTFEAAPLKASHVVKATNFLYKDISTSNITYSNKSRGLPSNGIIALTEDDQHAIWIATSDIGLIKYDGINYTIFDQSSGLAANSIEDVRFDKETGKLWCVYTSGVFYIKSNTVYTPSRFNTKFASSQFTTVRFFKKGEVWLTSRLGGLFQLTGNEYRNYTTQFGLNSDFVTDVLVDNAKNLWISAFGEVLKITEKNIYRYFIGQPGTPNKSVFCMAQDKKGNVWLTGFDCGLYCLNQRDTLNYSTSEKFDERIMDIVPGNNGVWFAMYGRGVLFVNDSSFMKFIPENGLNGRNTFRLFQDSFNNIWACDIMAGVSRINESLINLNPHYPAYFSSFTNQLTTRKGDTWYFFNGGKITKETPTGFYQYYNKGDNQYQSIQHAFNGIELEDGSIMATTYGCGICKIDDRNFTFYNYDADYGNKIMINLAEDHQGKVWFSTNQFGVLVLDHDSLYRLAINGKKMDPSFYALKADTGKQIWLTQGEKLFCSNSSGIWEVALNGKAMPSMVTCMLDLPHKGRIYGTSTEGIYWQHGNKAFQLTEKEGFFSNKITSLIMGRDGTIWVTTSEGIVAFQFNKERIVNYRVLDKTCGIHLLSLTGKSFLDSAGHPSFSSSMGILTYNNDMMHRGGENPILKYNSIYVDKVPINWSTPFTISYSQEITVYHQYFCWGQENQAKLSYGLIYSGSHDTVWVDLNGSTSYTIKNLKEGNYSLLHLLYVGNQRFYSNSIAFTVLPVWYNRWLYRVILFVAMGLVVVFYVKRKSRLALKKKLELEEIIRLKTLELMEEKKELESQNQLIATQNRQKDALISEIHHRVKNNLQSISILVEMQMLQTKNTKEEIQLLEEVYSRIMSMSVVHEMLYKQNDLSGIQAKVFFENLVKSISTIVQHQTQVAFTIQVEDVFLTADQCISIGMVTNEIITNSYKHAFKKVADPAIFIRLAVEGGQLKFAIGDNGPGMPEGYTKTTSSLGLRLIDIFCRQLGASYQLNNQQGTSYSILIPLKK